MPSSVRRFWLDPSGKLVAGVSGWLLDRVRNVPGGAASLEHVAVVVPTAQSGRNLRERLAVDAAARGQGAILPPRVMSPMGFVRNGAKRMEFKDELLAYVEALDRLDASVLDALFPRTGGRAGDWTVAAARELMDIAGRLETGGLRFADVFAAIRDPDKSKDPFPETEADRWRNLSAFERELDLVFAERGLVAPAQAIKDAIARPELPAGVELVALPALALPAPALIKALDNLVGTEIAVLVHAPASEADRFDRYGRVDPAYSRPGETVALDDIFRLATTDELATRIAADFRPGCALGLADESLWPEISAALSAHGVSLHNPMLHPLRQSSFGRLLLRTRRMVRGDADWKTFSAFVRDNDVRLWLEENGTDWRKLIDDTDRFQNKQLPQRAGEFELPAPIRALTGMPLLEALRTIYGNREVDLDDPSGREFAAAIKAGMDFLAAAADQDDAIFSALLDAAEYSLEPDGDALVSEGWLELPWSFSGRILIAGMTEGIVPDSINGHAFLPDSLAGLLGLDTNAHRYARDAFVMDELLRSHPGGVKAYFSIRNSAGDPVKPSRLLFRCPDAELLDRARKLIGGDRAVKNAAPVAPGDNRAWRLDLPEFVAPERVSPSDVDVFLRSPFEFFLRKQLGIRHPVRDDHHELEALEFGDVCHDILREFAASGLAASDDEARISGFLAELARRKIPGGSVIGRMQTESSIARFRRFAAWQAQAVRDGWRIRSFESCPRDIIVEGLAIGGRYDRLDERVSADGRTELRLIDYKTWNGISGHEPWKRRARGDRKGELEVKSLQLPLYAKMIGGGIDSVECGYLVLAEDKELWHPFVPDARTAAELEALITDIARRIRAADFQSGLDALSDDYRDFFA